jgi:hypothetical protein
MRTWGGEKETSQPKEAIPMKEKPTYTGNISPAGAQKVEAPVKVEAKKGKTKIKRGDDLRN